MTYTLQHRAQACSFLGSLVCCLLLTGVAQADITEGLISYWSFDGNFDDGVGNNNGTPMGADPIPFESGKFGQAIQLNGQDQFVEMPEDDNDFDMAFNLRFGGTGSVSVSAWATVDEFNKSWQALAAKGEGSNYRIARSGGGTQMSYAGGTGDITGGPDLAMLVEVPDPDNPGEVLQTYPGTDGEFHHIVAISERDVSTRLWIDGVLAVESDDAPTLTDNNLPFTIGENTESRGRTWGGKIDDVAVWERALTPEEVLGIWNGGAGAPVPEAQAVPEPSSVLLVVLGALSLGLVSRRRRG